MGAYAARSAIYIFVFWVLWHIAAWFEVAQNVSAFYPVTGLTIAFVSFFGWRYIPAVIVATTLSSFPEFPFWENNSQSWLQIARQTLAYGAAGLFIRHSVFGTLPLKTVSDTIGFLIVVLIASLLSAVLAITIFSSFDVFPSSAFDEIFLSFWVGDLSGAIMAAPITAILLNAFSSKSEYEKNRTLLTVSVRSMFVSILPPAAIAIIVFGVAPSHSSASHYGYIVILPVAWAAAEAGIKGGILSALAVNLVSVVVYNVSGEQTYPALELQVLFAFTATIGLTIGAIVDDRKRISRSEVDFRQLAENSIQGMLISNTERTPIFASSKCAEIFGYDNSEDLLACRDVMDLISPHDRERLLDQRLQSFEDTGVSNVLEFDGIRKDGTQVHVVAQSGNMIWRGQHCRFSTFIDITQQKEAESLLREAVESLDEGFALFDKDDRLAVFNHRYVELYEKGGSAIRLGRTYEEILREAIALGQFPDLIGREEEFVENRVALHHATPKKVELQLPNGRWLRTAEYATPSGGIGGLRSDITEEKLALQKILDADVRLRTIAENLSVPMVITRKSDGTILFANKESAEVAGVPLEEMVGRIADDNWVDPPARTHFLQTLDEHGEVKNFEILTRSTENAESWISASATLIEFDGYPSILTTFIDVTERRLAEGALRQSEAKLSAMVGIAPEGVISLDADLSIVLFNRGAERIFGYQASEIMGCSLSKLIPDRFRERHGNHVDNFLHSDDDTLLMSQRSEVFGQHKDGSEFAAEASVSKVLVGEQMMFTVMIQDITKRKEIEQQLALAYEAAETANRTKSEFLANMSHELRTPLNSVLGFSEIIENQSYGPVGSEKYLEYARDIHEAGNHLLALINDVLDISKIEAGQMFLSKQEVGLNRAIDSALRMIKERAFKKTIKLDVTLDSSVPTVLGDDRAIRQIVLNLLTNSVKFTPEGGTITVTSTVESEHRVMVQIVDTGVGIAASDIAKVLEPFGQVTPVEAREHEGTGLGLPLSKRLTELQDGTFDLESELGVGTTVRLTLPARSVDQLRSPS